MLAQVDHSSQRVFRCFIPETGESVSACALGNLLKEGEIVVGDYVELTHGAMEKEYTIIKVLPRTNEIYRMFVRDNRKKVVASNGDLLVIVVSVQKPTYKRGLIDRYLIRSFQWGIPAIVVFNKADLGDEEVDLSFEASRLAFLQVPCFEVSAVSKESYQQKKLKLGFLDLKELLRERTSLFMGQSGVGKSCLISALTDGVISLKSRAVGKIGKGTHTTTWSEMVRFENFKMIDSPGVRSFSLEDVTSELLMNAFPDVAHLTPYCKFNKCLHDERAQGCVFRREDFDQFVGDEWERLVLSHRQESLNNSSLLPLLADKVEGIIVGARQKLLLSRLESYLKIYDELKANPVWENLLYKKD